MQKFRIICFTIEQYLKKLSYNQTEVKNKCHLIALFTIRTMVILFIIYLFFLIFSIYSLKVFLFLSILSLLCNIINIIIYKDLEIEKYFSSDKVIYDRVNKRTMVENSIWFNLFIVIFYIISMLTFRFVIVYDEQLLKSVLFIIIFISLIFITSWRINEFITSYIIEYNFTINFTFVKSKYRRRLWIYLRNRSEVLKRIANDEKLFKIEEIKEQDSGLVSFSEIELVKNEIKNLTTKQLEFILFKDKLPVFNKNNILSKRVFYSFGAVLIFFGQEIKTFFLNIGSGFIQCFSYEKFIQTLINDINENFDIFVLLVILLFLYIILPIFWLLKKIIIFFLNYRQTTIDDYLNDMLKEELKNRYEKLNIKLKIKNKIEISD